MPRRPRRTEPTARLALPVLLAALALTAGLLAACDNPACIYGGDCFGGGGPGGALGSNPASVPSDNAWLLPGAPTVTGFFPAGSQIATTTPIVVRFSESMSAASLDGALELAQVGASFGGNVPLLPPALVGDGRLLVLLPALDLQASTTYELRYRENRIVYDLLGTTLAQPADRVIGSFTVADSDPFSPRVVATWPPNGATNQSGTGEVVVVFDREMQSGNQTGAVTVDSFVVTVDGSPPPDNPAPQTVVFAGSVGLPTTDTRAWRWRSTDALGSAVPLGAGKPVQVELSPSGHAIQAVGGGVLPNQTIDFDLLPFDAPLSAELVSIPTDAIGIANLDGSVPLELAVEVSGGLSSDVLGVFLFGQSKTVAGKLVALFREVTLGQVGYDPLVGVATLGEAELDLASSLAPVEARFADGSLAVALRLERGGVVSTVRMLDTDDSDAQPQPAWLDTTRPKVVGLSSAGTNLSSLRSDLADLVVVGRADEPVRAAEVATGLGDNGMQPPVVAWNPPSASTDDGLFVAAPVALGVIDPASQPLPFTLRIYDRALNASAAPLSASFTQLGTSVPRAAPPAATTTVQVFDLNGLGPVQGARVFTHEYTGAGAATYLDDDFTDSGGRATLVASTTAATIVTVDASGFDLFSFQGSASAWLGVPLARSSAASGTFQGTLTTTDFGVPSMVKWAADNRLRNQAGDVVAVQSCSFDPLTLGWDCVYGPAPITSGPLGAAAVVAVIPPPSEFSYAAQSFLRGWRARLPRKPVASGQTSLLDFDLDETLDAAGVPQEERVVDGPLVDLGAAGISGLSLGSLDGAPRVGVQARLRGLGGTLLAGYGVAFDQSGTPTDTWRVRSAYPGLVDPTDTKYPGDERGQLVEDGVISPELWLRCELRDQAGNVSVRRARLTALAPPPGVNALGAIDVPTLSSPASGANTGGSSYDLVFAEVLAPLGQRGLYRATLRASNGRRWALWRPDAAGATLTLHVPDIASAGGSPLVNGAITATVDVFAWPSFDPGQPFAWSDLQRQVEASATAAQVVFAQP